MATINIGNKGWVYSSPPGRTPINHKGPAVSMYAKCKCGVRSGNLSARDINAWREAQRHLLPWLRDHHKREHRSAA